MIVEVEALDVRVLSFDRIHDGLFEQIVHHPPGGDPAVEPAQQPADPGRVEIGVQDDDPAAPGSQVQRTRREGGGPPHPALERVEQGDRRGVRFRRRPGRRAGRLEPAGLHEMPFQDPQPVRALCRSGLAPGIVLPTAVGLPFGRAAAKHAARPVRLRDAAEPLVDRPSLFFPARTPENRTQSGGHVLDEKDAPAPIAPLRIEEFEQELLGPSASFVHVLHHTAPSITRVPTISSYILLASASHARDVSGDEVTNSARGSPQRKQAGVQPADTSVGQRGEHVDGVPQGGEIVRTRRRVPVSSWINVFIAHSTTYPAR